MLRSYGEEMTFLIDNKLHTSPHYPFHTSLPRINHHTHLTNHRTHPHCLQHCLRIVGQRQARQWGSWELRPQPTQAMPKRNHAAALTSPLHHLCNLCIEPLLFLE